MSAQPYRRRTRSANPDRQANLIQRNVVKVLKAGYLTCGAVRLRSAASRTAHFARKREQTVRIGLRDARINQQLVAVMDQRLHAIALCLNKAQVV